MGCGSSKPAGGTAGTHVITGAITDRKLADVYHIKEELGKGSFATVHKVGCAHYVHAHGLTVDVQYLVCRPAFGCCSYPACHVARASSDNVDCFAGCAQGDSR